MASSVVVSDRQTLEENFVENGLNVFCQASFGAGAYAIGGTLLGFPPLSVPAALLTTGALLGAMAVCPSRPNGDDIFGKPPGFAGGQCPAIYQFAVTGTWVRGDGLTRTVNSQDEQRMGPILGLREVSVPIGGSDSVSKEIRVLLSGGQEITMLSVASTPSSPDNSVVWRDFSFLRLFRPDGQPDNCGDPPRVGGQIITNNITGDTIDNSKVTDNKNFFTTIPVLVNVGGVNGSLNVDFGGIKIGSLFPLQFDIKIGGVRFRIGEEPDGKYKLKPVNPDPNGPSSETEEGIKKIEDLLKEIKKCVCKPEVDLDLLFVPYVDASDSCKVLTETLLVPKGSVSSSTVRKLENSAELARMKCEEKAPEQLAEVLLFAATTSLDGRELFTPELDLEIASVRIKITSVNNADLPIISLYPAARQRKFGSVSYVMASVSGGGDYVYIFDEDTYLPLPRHAKKGRLRILFKKGVSFEIYDTGERF
jgi:hypothetical protein